MNAVLVILALGAEGISLEQAGYTRAAVSIECRLSGNALAMGSGTIVGNTEGRAVVITAAHVVEGALSVKVTSQEHTKAARVLARDTELDVAILWSKSFEGVNPVPLSKYGPPAPGEAVEACGFGPSVFWCRSATVVKPPANEPWLCTRGPGGVLTVSGDSGGPIFHRHRLAGVIWGNRGGRSDDDRCTMATPAWRVRRLIDRQLPAVVKYLAE